MQAKEELLKYFPPVKRVAFQSSRKNATLRNKTESNDRTVNFKSSAVRKKQKTAEASNIKQKKECEKPLKKTKISTVALETTSRSIIVDEKYQHKVCEKMQGWVRDIKLRFDNGKLDERTIKEIKENRMDQLNNSKKLLTSVTNRCSNTITNNLTEKQYFSTSNKISSGKSDKSDGSVSSVDIIDSSQIIQQPIEIENNEMHQMPVQSLQAIDYYSKLSAESSAKPLDEPSRHFDLAADRYSNSETLSKPDEIKETDCSGPPKIALNSVFKQTNNENIIHANTPGNSWDPLHYKGDINSQIMLYSPLRKCSDPIADFIPCLSGDAPWRDELLNYLRRLSVETVGQLAQMSLLTAKLIPAGDNRILRLRKALTKYYEMHNSDENTVSSDGKCDDVKLDATSGNKMELNFVEMRKDMLRAILNPVLSQSMIRDIVNDGDKSSKIFSDVMSQLIMVTDRFKVEPDLKTLFLHFNQNNS